MGATIRVERARRGWSGRARKFMVLVDGTESGKLAYGDSVDVPVPAGTHMVKARLDLFWGSPTIDVTVGEGETAVVEIAGKNVLLSLLLLFWPPAYLAIEPKSSAATTEVSRASAP